MIKPHFLIDNTTKKIVNILAIDTSKEFTPEDGFHIVEDILRPVIVRINGLQEELLAAPTIDWYYDSETNTFTPPEGWTPLPMELDASTPASEFGITFPEGQQIDVTDFVVETMQGEYTPTIITE